MSKSIGNELPSEIHAQLDGRRLEAGIGLTVMLLTSDEEGWTSVALLSVGEVVAPTSRTVRLALWPGTTSTANLTRRSRGVLALFGEALAYYVRIETHRKDNLRVGGMDHAYFEGTIQDVLRDEVTYARMTGGLTFELPDPEAVLARWRATVDAMLGQPTATAATGETRSPTD